MRRSSIRSKQHVGFGSLLAAQQLDAGGLRFLCDLAQLAQRFHASLRGQQREELRAHVGNEIELLPDVFEPRLLRRLLGRRLIQPNLARANDFLLETDAIHAVVAGELVGVTAILCGFG